jgi:hypothetical protein
MGWVLGHWGDKCSNYLTNHLKRRRSFNRALGDRDNWVSDSLFQA